MEDYKGKDENHHNEREEIYSKAVRAGKRTYFFDVKATKKNDYYITITESKRQITPDDKFYYEKHKIFLYKEDFENFAEGLNEVVQYIRNNNFAPDKQENTSNNTKSKDSDFTDISFDDLETKKTE